MKLEKKSIRRKKQLVCVCACVLSIMYVCVHLLVCIYSYGDQSSLLDVSVVLYLNFS